MANFAELAAPLVASFEGCGKKGADGLYWPYLDKLAKPPVWTRGFGRCYGISETSAGITRDEAIQELQTGLYRYGMEVAKYAPILLTKPACHAAVTSWAWNCGTGAFARSRLCKAIKEGRWDDAAELIAKPETAGGVFYRGLKRRRTAEQALFRSGI